jgi:hypothetical protein
VQQHTLHEHSYSANQQPPRFPLHHSSVLSPSATPPYTIVTPISQFPSLTLRAYFQFWMRIMLYYGVVS